ncbi:2431_t:CDS:2, partial [Paraglomus occultum]
MYSFFHQTQKRRLYSQLRFITTATPKAQTHPDTELDSALKYCIDLVRQDNDLISYRHSIVTLKHDYENYLISAFYPKEVRPAHVAIRAFNLEIAMVRENVSNAQIGSMRMQFWREAIDGVFKGNPPKHPIAL